MFRGNWRGSSGGGGGGGGGGTAELVWDATSTSSYTFSGSYNALKVDVTSNSVSVILPGASGYTGKVYTVKHVAGDISVYTISISSSSGTIDGLSSVTINQNLSTTRLSSDGTNWFII